MTSIRILNLNIWNYNNPWVKRRGLIVDLIRNTKPDVVALQEIRYHDWPDDRRHQAGQILAELSGYTCIWHPAHYWHPHTSGIRGEAKWEGLAILSRYPIVDQRDCRWRLVYGCA